MRQDEEVQARAVEKGIARLLGKGCAVTILFLFASFMGFIVFLAWLFGANGAGR